MYGLTSTDVLPLELVELIDGSIKAVGAKKMPIDLKRGFATIPLKGVDVPFHSSYLQVGVDALRRCFLENIDSRDIDARQLIGRYIPNLTGKPFEISESY